MSRERFQNWGTSLSSTEFRCALAAAGVLSTLAPPRQPDLAGLIAERLGTGDLPTRWRFPWAELDRRRRRIPDERVHEMAMAWQEASHLGRGTGEGSGRVRLLLDLDGAAGAAGWVARELSEPDVRAGAVSIHQERRGRVHWTWPLQVGCLDEPPSNRLLFQLRRTRYSDTLSPVRVLHGRGESCDLLVLPYSLREAAAVVLAQVPPVRASCIAVLGGTLEPWERTAELQAVLRDETGAAGVFIAAVPVRARGPWFEHLVVELSHNFPLDVALSIATKWVMYQGEIHSRPRSDLHPLFFATEALLEEARLGSAALRLARRMANAPPTAEVEVTPEDAGVLDVDAGRIKVRDLSAGLRKAINNFSFSSERGDASVLARMEGSISALPVTPVPRPEDPRYLQARVYEVAPDPTPRLLLQDSWFRAGATHHVDVHVGPRSPQWLKGKDSEVFPAHLLPRSAAGHELRVVFSEPRHLDAPQIAPITLPATGASSVCRFTFVPRADVPEVEARIAVLYENRVLQTALLRGSVQDEPSHSSRHGDQVGISVEIEAVVHPDVSALEDRSHFHAALVLNRNNDGAARGTAAVGDRVGVLDLDGLEDTLKFIRGVLSKTPPSRTGPTKKEPFTPETVELLRTLAYQGRMLHDALVDQLGDALSPATRIQVVAAKPDAFLPLELVYDRTSPAPDAEMCPHAVEAARTGSCPDCPTLKDDIPSPYVCPAGFWALSRVIERHAFDRAAPRPETSFELFDFDRPTRTRGTLRPLRCALYAASDRVEGESARKKTRIQRVLKALERASGAARLADSWTAWKKGVEEQHPSLLVVLSHTVYDSRQGALGLEIAKQDRLLSGHISRAHVCGLGSETAAADEAREPPVVLLLGCETIAPEVPYQGFVPAFRRAGAAVVLCTNSTVLGREVAPAAERLVGILREITAGGDEVTFADAVLQLRRDSVASGMPMGLGLVAYGDADWRISN